jgi:hypothetical protein
MLVVNLLNRGATDSNPDRSMIILTSLCVLYGGYTVGLTPVKVALPNVYKDLFHNKIRIKYDRRFDL